MEVSFTIFIHTGSQIDRNYVYTKIQVYIHDDILQIFILRIMSIIFELFY